MCRSKRICGLRSGKYPHPDVSTASTVQIFWREHAKVAGDTRQAISAHSRRGSLKRELLHDNLHSSLVALADVAGSA
jgi:hypothetical protein